MVAHDTLPAIHTVGLLRDQWVTFTRVSAALLLMHRWPAVLQRLRIVGNAGRMALTNSGCAALRSA